MGRPSLPTKPFPDFNPSYSSKWNTTVGSLKPKHGSSWHRRSKLTICLRFSGKIYNRKEIRVVTTSPNRTTIKTHGRNIVSSYGFCETPEVSCRHSRRFEGETYGLMVCGDQRYTCRTGTHRSTRGRTTHLPMSVKFETVVLGVPEN